MSKQYLKDVLRDQQENNYLFSSIKRDWVKESELNAQDYVWSKRLNPSALSFTMCPYETIRAKAGGRESCEAAQIQYMEVGKAFHTMFQERAMKIPGLLWDKPVFKTKEETEKLEANWPEIPFFWEQYALSGRADLILNIKDKPVLIDLKIPQRAPTAWEAYIKKLPEESHLTQCCVAALAINEMGLLTQPIEKVGVAYFNPNSIPMKGDGFQERYVDFNMELQRKTRMVLAHAHRELVLYLADQPSSCTYPLCKKHFEIQTRVTKKEAMQ